MATIRSEVAPAATPALTGLESLLSLPPVSALELRAAVRQGLPFTCFEALARSLQLSQGEITAVLGIPARTVARRRASGSLTPQESDRLYRIARAIEQASEVLGSLEKARLWLKTPNRALAGEIPLALLDTEIGSRQVDEVLQRINHGIFS